MDSKLFLVTQSGSVDALYSLIKKHPCMLQNADVLPFIHTPLHEASRTGKIDLAMELMILRPSFAKKLNSDGFSPLHLAIENRQVELALELVKFDPSLVRIHGREDLLTEFLLVCPESIRDANVKGETALHVTVANNRYEELKVLRGWMQRMRKIDASSTEIQVLNKRDREGNTALHLAASKNNHQNKSGMTALDVLRANGPHMNIETEKIIQKAGGQSAASLSNVKKTSVFLSKPVTFKEYCSTGMARYRSGISDGTRNALLVITALVITATYQTAAQPREQDDEDLSILDIILQIVLMWGLNTIAFLVAIVLTFILLPVGRAYTWWWKRTTQKKVPHPKTELLFGGLKTMV
ncbi:hypothetical protein AALP_AA8G330500 [Arabis alpina]|uniref:Uncharacterized protein n=1 Tax=Arabis alpina TaxID=50452 RepID=A0A087GB19_ARAAL|nr:hypothetical protein AALP_AA8G330500 [Arabis alpina]